MQKENVIAKTKTEYEEDILAAAREFQELEKDKGNLIDQIATLRETQKGLEKDLAMKDTALKRTQNEIRLLNQHKSNLMQDLKDDFDLSYVFISHDLSVVEHICDRIAVMYLGTIFELAPSESFCVAPMHPYTRALLMAVPQPDPHTRAKPLDMEGDVPNPIDPPPGCTFHPRCPNVFDRCRVECPSLVEVAPNHHVACWMSQP